MEVLHSGYPFVYLRGGRFLVVVNPRSAPAAFTTGLVAGTAPRALEAEGVEAEGGAVTARGFGYGVFDLGPTANPS